MTSTLPAALRGAVSGLLATAAMSTVMLAAQRRGAIDRLPPRLIVDHLLPGLEDRAARVSATALHLAIGAAAGCGLAAAVPRGLLSLSAGPAYGLLLWVVGYQGVVPMLGALPPAHRDRPARVLTTIGAHLVYGAAVGQLLRRG